MFESHVRVGSVVAVLAALAPAQNSKVFDVAPRADAGGGSKVTVKFTKDVEVTKVTVDGKEVEPTTQKSGSTVELTFSEAYNSKNEVKVTVSYSGSTAPALARSEGPNPKWETPKAPVYREL